MTCHFVLAALLPKPDGTHEHPTLQTRVPALKCGNERSSKPESAVNIQTKGSSRSARPPDSQEHQPPAGFDRSLEKEWNSEAWHLPSEAQRGVESRGKAAFCSGSSERTAISGVDRWAQGPPPCWQNKSLKISGFNTPPISGLNPQP